LASEPPGPIPTPRWQRETGPDSDVVISSRCRLARNIEGFPFPWRASDGELKHSAEMALNAIRRSGGIFSSGFNYQGERLAPETLSRLLEFRYASLEWTRSTSHRWLVITPDGSASLMLNEEDHLRFQAILPGLQVESVYSLAREAVEQLEVSLRYAEKADIGYLTASLTNAGTGLRLSALLHLPGLSSSQELETILEAAEQTGCAVRGVYGEGTHGTGELFQVSNSYTFRADPLQIVTRVNAATSYLVDAERRARHERFSSSHGRSALREATQEALGLLMQEEAAQERLLSLVSVLRLAVAEGILEGNLAETAEWIAIAGPADKKGGSDALSRSRFEAVRRTSAIRQRLRRFQSPPGTFRSDFAE
jgi:protein arginine kinase